MQPLLTPEQMAKADKATIAAGTLAGSLMDRAGRAIARAAIELMGGRYGKRALVVCGKGSNGGDGFVAARVLRDQGVGVDCLVLFDPEEATGASADHLRLMRNAGVEPQRFHSGKWEPRHGYNVAIDAIFGTGFKGAIDDDSEVADVIELLDHIPVVAADIPSGVNGATGAVEGEAVRAKVTVAIGAQKVGTATGEGAVRAGRVEVAPIGIHDVEGRSPWSERKPGATWMLDAEDLVLPGRSQDAHKRSSGSVLVIAGSDAMPGAAVLTATAALRSGAGYVTLGSTERTCAIASARMPELVTAFVPEADALGPRTLDELSQQIGRADAVAIGPGLGEGDEQRDLLVRCLKEIDAPLVIDADGLNVLASDPGALTQRDADTILTPHPAELARLLNVDTDAVQADRLGAAESAARSLRCIVLLKGYRTVVAAFDPETDDVERWVIPTGGPELATAGTGDVLTGVIAALVAARPEHPRSATVTGSYLHGVAGEIAVEGRGMEGVVAGDVAEALPLALERLRAGLASRA